MNIYCDYEVKMIDKGCNRVGNNEFEDFEHQKDAVLNGGQLFDLFAINLSSKQISEFKYEKNKELIIVTFELFNPISGESGTTTYEIKLKGDSNE